MLTYACAMELLMVCDTVFILQENRIIPAKISRMYGDRVKTNKGDLYYRDYPGKWFLTKIGAKKHLEERNGKKEN